MKPIENKNIGYILTRSYVQFAFKEFYGEYIIKGLENLPEDKPVIFAPNHLNALMDALAVATLPPHKKTKVFLARADVFHHPLAARFLRAIKILPAFRIRDGYENLDKNTATFMEAVGALTNNATLCIMPEGNQGTERNIRPLVKGIFRIAFQAQEALGEKHPVQIVPVGIDMGDFVKYKKHIIIEIGKPIDVLSYLPDYKVNQAGTINQVRSHLKNELEQLIVHIPTGDSYESMERIIQQHENIFPDNTKTKVKNTYDRFKTRKAAVKMLISLKENKKEAFGQIEKLSKEIESDLIKYNLRTENFIDNKPVFPWIKLALSIILFPIFSIAFLSNFLPVFLPVWIRKKMKVAYKGFWSSIHFTLGLLTFPVFYIIQSVIAGLIFSTHLWGVIAFIFIHFYLHKIGYILYKFYKKTIAEYNLWILYNNHKKTYDRINSSIKRISEILTQS